MEYELRITGMHCAGCAQSIERYLAAEPGVEEAIVRYDAERGTIAVSPDAEIEELVAVIDRMGYNATLLTAE